VKLAEVTLACVRFVVPTVKLNEAGVIVAFERFAGSGCDSVNEPEMLQSGGQAAEPVNVVNGFPVMLYVVEATTGTSVPVPASETACCALTKSPCESVITREAERAPRATGAKVAKMLQLLPGVRAEGEIGQLFVWAKSVGLAPEIAILEMITFAPPVLLMATVCAGLVVETI